MPFTATLTAVATSVGILLVVVLAVAPGLLELWENLVERRSARRTRSAEVVRLDRADTATTSVPAAREDYHRAA